MTNMGLWYLLKWLYHRGSYRLVNAQWSDVQQRMWDDAIIRDTWFSRK